MKIGAVQMGIIKGDKKTNLTKLDQMLAETKLDLAVLPELFSTGYFFATRDEYIALSEVLPDSPTVAALTEIAARRNCHIVGSLIERDGDDLYLTAVLVGPQGYVGKQRKRHPTADDRRWYEAGDESTVFDVLGYKVGMLVCFDGWFPESLRELKLRGAQLVCHVALISSPESMGIMRLRALENRMFVAIGNAIGTECWQGQTLAFRGESRIIDCLGNIVADGGKNEGIVVAEIEPQQASEKAMADCEDLLAEIAQHKGLYN